MANFYNKPSYIPYISGNLPLGSSRRLKSSTLMLLQEWDHSAWHCMEKSSALKPKTKHGKSPLQFVMD